MGIVSNAWAGFGAAFGPAILFSLYCTVSGIIGGAVTVLLWEYVLTIGDNIYSIIPGVIVSVILTVVVSLLDKAPSKEVTELYELAKTEPTA